MLQNLQKMFEEHYAKYVSTDNNPQNLVFISVTHSLLLPW